MVGSSYIKTPRSLKTQSLVNVMNKKDDKCFIRSILANLNPAKD